MPRGGKREGSGAKSKWKHGKTTVIRVPEALADQVLAFAKELDDGESFDCVSESKVIDMSDFPLITVNSKAAVFLGDLMAAGYEIQPDILAERVLDEVYKCQLKRANGAF